MDDESAFPVSTIDGFTRLGMSLRDWFAGQALPAIITAVSAGQHSLHPDRQIPDSFATDAYAYADAMLAQRMKDTDNG